MSGEAVIRAAGLTKSFGNILAVAGLSLEVKKGELYCLVGPDGAGKTTALRLLSAVMEPTGGEAWVAGLSTIKEPEAVKEAIGYAPQRFGLYEDLTVAENLDFYADIFDVPAKARAERTRRLLAFSGLAPFTARLAGRLSGGMKQKLSLACALIHNPSVLLLDEPTNGVDPVSRREFWKLLYGLLKEGMSILLSTSYLDEAERAGRVGLMLGGRIIAEGSPDSLRRSFGLAMLEFSLDDARGAAGLARSAQGVNSVYVYGDRLHIAAGDAEISSRLEALLKSGGFDVRGVRVITPSLEDVFIKMAGAHERS